jgi:hypothetical protein
MLVGPRAARWAAVGVRCAETGTRAEEGDMAAPEDWVGQEVAARLDIGGGRNLRGVLDEVNDRGLVLRTEVRDEGELPVFYPWAYVHWVYPTSQPSEQGSRRRRARARPAEKPEDSAP